MKIERARKKKHTWKTFECRLVVSKTSQFWFCFCFLLHALWPGPVPVSWHSLPQLQPEFQGLVCEQPCCALAAVGFRDCSVSSPALWLGHGAHWPTDLQVSTDVFMLHNIIFPLFFEWQIFVKWSITAPPTAWQWKECGMHLILVVYLFSFKSVLKRKLKCITR